MPLRIAVCDADVTALLKSVRLLDHFLYKNNLDADADIDVFLSGNDLLAKRADGRHYDLYLLDAVQPNVDGLALGRKIRETNAETPIVYLAALADDAPLPEAIPEDCFIRKPCDYESFAAALTAAGMSTT